MSISNHLESCIKEFWQHNEVDSDIFFPGRQNLMGNILVQEKNFPCGNRHPLLPNDMGHFTLAHIKHFYIIVVMLWEITQNGCGDAP